MNDAGIKLLHCHNYHGITNSANNARVKMEKSHSFKIRISPAEEDFKGISRMK